MFCVAPNFRQRRISVRGCTLGRRFFFATNANEGSSSDEDLPVPGCSQPLGAPLPFDEHACSVSLPTWSSVVGYEEGDESIVSALRCGYPRFVYHPYVIQLMDAIVKMHGDSSSQDCLVLPTAQAAARCQAFLQQTLEGRKDFVDNALIAGVEADERSTSSRVQIVSLPEAEVHAVLFPAETIAGMEAKAYWQHTGEIVSSRRAEIALQKLGVRLDSHITSGPGSPFVFHSSFKQPSSSTPHPNTKLPHDSLRRRIADWADVPSDDNVFLVPSGMASIYAAMRSARRYHLQKNPIPGNKGGASIVYGFPYLDTLKLCSRSEFCPAGVEFFGRGDDKDLAKLEELLESGRRSYSALFTELPSNPLLQCPDIYRLRELADEYDFSLIVDDTISNFLNVDILRSGLADAVCTSLTKLVSGRGDAMAGSIIASPYTPKGQWMQKDMAHYFDSSDCGLHESDAAAILLNSVDFPERNEKINATAERLADWLEDHPDVQRVHYPKSAPDYKSVQAVGGGFGGLMSVILHPHMCQRTFYDALDVAKGPSLGTDFTLICPYTLLAHYHELDFAMSYNVPPNLLRISVGLEPFNALQSKFQNAFERSRLYPKVCMEKFPSQQSRSYSTYISRSAFRNRTLRLGLMRATSLLLRR